MTDRLKNSAIFSAPTISFVLDEDQVDRANRWAKQHKCASAGRYGSAGDKFSFTFCPSGIGDFAGALHTRRSAGLAGRAGEAGAP